jgi:hypothetical protein
MAPDTIAGKKPPDRPVLRTAKRYIKLPFARTGPHCGSGGDWRVTPPAKKPEKDVSDEEYRAHENALIAQWLELLDEFAKLPAHRLQAIVKMLEHHTEELAGALRPRLLVPAEE